MSVEIESAVSKEAVVARSQKNGEPAWLQEFRLKGWEAYAGLPLPQWDRTDISSVSFDGLVTEYDGGESERAKSLAAGQGEDAAYLIVEHGKVAARRLPDALEKQGVVLATLEEAAASHPDLVREHLGSAVPADEDKILGLQAAMMRGGLFVYVPPNVDVEVPLQYALWAEAPGFALFPRVLVVADRGSRVSIVESNGSHEPAESDRIVLQAVEVVALDNANVTYSVMQEWGRGVVNVTARRAKVHRDATVEWCLGDLGGSLVRAATHTFMEGDGSQGNAMFVFFADGEQHMDVGVTMTHVGHYTGSDLQGKGVVSDRARCVYRGMTDIEFGAKNTTAFQHENTLILSKEARVDAIPGLEIDDPEVQAGHAATVGKIDDVHLFYMMSRGVPKNKAIHLIVDGFFDPILQRFPIESFRESVQQTIAKKLTT